MQLYWENQLQELQAQRAKRREEAAAGKTDHQQPVIEIEDDDFKGGSEAELEKKSLENAEKGIVLIEDDVVLMKDGYAEVVPSEEKLEIPAQTSASTDPSMDDSAKRREELIR